MDLTSFQKSYNEIRGHFNSKKEGFSTSTDIAPVDTTSISVKILSAVALMLVHNSENNEPSGLNIDTLEGYDLNKLKKEDYEMFEPYIGYLLLKRFKDPLKVYPASLYANYVATFIRYLFIAQKREVRQL